MVSVSIVDSICVSVGTIVSDSVSSEEDSSWISVVSESCVDVGISKSMLGSVDKSGNSTLGVGNSSGIEGNVAIQSIIFCKISCNCF